MVFRVVKSTSSTCLTREQSSRTNASFIAEISFAETRNSAPSFMHKKYAIWFRFSSKIQSCKLPIMHKSFLDKTGQPEIFEKFNETITEKTFTEDKKIVFLHTTHNDSDCINVRINSLTINHTDENGNRLEKGKVYMETSTYIPS